ncbi:MAG: hypothetical protein K6T75_06230 [Acetobacteraceae bacterium]|nr:hypothetical protein [Acetobacteraceae bacterium]
MTGAGALELEVLAAVRAGRGLMAYPVRLRLELGPPGTGVSADPARFSPEWLEYAGIAIEAAARLAEAAGAPRLRAPRQVPAKTAAELPGLRVRLARPKGGGSAPGAKLTGRSASLPLALGVLCLLQGALWPAHFYATGVLEGPGGRLLPGNPEALLAKAAALDHLAAASGFTFRLLCAPSTFVPPRGLRGEVVEVEDLAAAAGWCLGSAGHGVARRATAPAVSDRPVRH